MNEKWKVVTGLVVAVIIGLFPIWYALAMGSSDSPPDVELPQDEEHCVEAREFMIANHMNLLNQWRDAVVRQGETEYVSRDFGTTYVMNFTETCMGCHTDSTTFCTRCHDYADVQPYCWDCHHKPEELRDGQE